MGPRLAGRLPPFRAAHLSPQTLAGSLATPGGSRPGGADPALGARQPHPVAASLGPLGAHFWSWAPAVSLPATSMGGGSWGRPRRDSPPRGGASGETRGQFPGPRNLGVCLCVSIPVHV